MTKKHNESKSRQCVPKLGLTAGLYRLAEKRIATFAKERWLEMGMLTFTIAAYTLPNGQLAVTAYVYNMAREMHC